MSKIIKVGENKPAVLQNCAIAGITFDAILFGKTDNIAIVKPGLDLDLILVKITLYKGGREFMVYNGKLKAGIMESSIFNSSWSNVYPNSANYASLITLVAGASNKETSVAPARLDFDGVIILKGKDKMVVEVNVLSGACAATADETTSYILIDGVAAVGKMNYVPLMDVISIDAAIDQFATPSFDNVTSITWLNYNKSDILTASKVIESVSLSSDRYNYTKNYNQLLADRVEHFPTLAEANDRDQCLVLYRGTEIDNCSLSFQLNSTNVTAAKNYIVVRRFVTYADLVIEQEERTKKHRNQLARKVGLKLN